MCLVLQELFLPDSKQAAPNPGRISVLAHRRVNVCSVPSSNTSSTLTTHLKSSSVPLKGSAFPGCWNKHWTSLWLFSAGFPVVPSLLCGIPSGEKGFRTSLRTELWRARYLQQLCNIRWAHVKSTESPLFMVKDHPGQEMFSKSLAVCVGHKS